MSFLDNTGLSYFYGKLKEKFIRSVSAGGDTLTPDASGNVAITNVATADNLTSPDAQTYYADFIYRTSGGSASLSSGEANLVYVDGNMSISGRVAENLDVTATNGLSVTYNLTTWGSQISTSGTYTFSYTKPTSSSAATTWTDSGTWEYNGNTVTLATYGLTVSNLTNPSILVAVSGSGITAATVIPSTFTSQITTSGSYVFTYDGSNWLLNESTVTLSDYGLVATGTAANADTITVALEVGTADSTITAVYTAPERGVISIPTPTGFSATGFNQFDNSTMYIADATISGGVVASSSGSYLCYCRAVGGVTNGYVAYSSGGYISDIGWCATLPVVGTEVDQTTTSIAATLSSVEFDDDGYVVVVVSDMSDLCVHPKWSGSADEEYAAYVAPSTITFPTVDTSNVTIPIGDYGMPAVGSVADRLNLDAGTYIKRIGRLSNTASNMEYVVSLDTAYDYDNDYIYYVLLSPITYTVSIDPVYTVNDWGAEEFLGTSVSLYAQTLYGQNLRDKLRTDVLTISEQSPALSDSQKKQVTENLGQAVYISGTISSSSLTLSSSSILSTMRVVECTFGTPANVASDLTWTTADGSITFSGTLSGSTTISLVLVSCN